MFKSRLSPCPLRRKRLIAGAAMLAASLLITPEAQAAEPGAERALGSTAFGVPRLSWNMAPELQLQPERARLMLVLPPEWMPTPDFGALGRLGMPLDPSKSWVFRRPQRTSHATSVTIGTSVRLRITDPSRSIDFGLRLMPRAAIAVLRFDPTARLH